MKLLALTAVIGALCACAGIGTPAAPAPLAGRLVDLTHGFDSTTLYWPTESEGFVLDPVAEGITEGGYFYAANRFHSAEHGGTHLDAPFHFSEHGIGAGRLPLDRLIGPAFVIDVRGRVAADRDYLVRIADFTEWEGRHGRLPERAIVLLRTGWSERWPDRERYLGTAQRGASATGELHFPGLDPEAARWLVEERRVASVGLDTPSIDHGPSRDFRAHRALAAAQVPVFENLGDLAALPERGAFLIALPMKITDGSGAPLRAVAVLP